MNSSEKTTLIKTKQALLVLFLLVFVAPVFQLALPFVNEKPLNGVDLAPPLPDFSPPTWINEEYQKNYSLAFEQNIGFHNSLVRMYNQLNYTFFGFASGAVVVGEKDVLFLTSYIDAYTGGDFLGEEYIEIQTTKIKFLQDVLKKKNIDFFVIFAPGKGSFYSEYIPKRNTSGTKNGKTNYGEYKKMFSNSGVKFLDLCSIFLSKKQTEKHPLYSNTGVHWSEYGCFIAGKELVSYIEKLRNIKLPKINVHSIKIASLSGNHSSDYDAASLMNIISTVPHPNYAIPKLEFVSDSTTIRPRFLCIADSYFSGIINTDIPSNVFTDYHYWLYNDGVYPETFLKTKHHDKKQLKKDLEKQDIVCLLATDASLTSFPFGFIDEAYETYAAKDSNYYALKNKEFHRSVVTTIKRINENYTWKKQLIENAKKKKISAIDEFIINAIWIYEQEQMKIKNG